ncbi:serine protease [Pseudomonas sp. Irchel s3b2]|uniref:trypsin-like serine peptidase n=1 Tax=Pseudomonas sp. Irchel s3b2 TaxID=2009073 RepID=UPI000BA41039|nr:trypsin-like peptidase domain-containing protein [Pseudomonas sp. Irchel s3b2]
MKYIKHLTLCCLLIASTCLHARDLGEGAINGSTSKALQNQDKRYSLWSGIGRLTFSSGASCTASLLDTRNSQGKAVGPAYLITSGHCVLYEYGTSRTDIAIDANITFNYFHDEPERQITYPVRTAVWSSTVGTDLAVIRIERSLASLIKAGIKPLPLAAHQNDERRDVLNIGAPSGFTEQGLRMSVCSEQSAGSFIGHPGVFSLATRNRCDAIRVGSSGSPMLDRGNGDITSIVSKYALPAGETGRSECSYSGSCEASTYNYSYSANFLHHCFINGVFDGNSQNCLLQPVNIAVEAPWRIRSHVYIERGTFQERILPTWNYRFSISSPFYRYKTTRDARNCHRPADYSAALESTAPSINQAIGPQTGIHVLCIIGVSSAEQSITKSLLRTAFTWAVYLIDSTTTVETR